MKSAQPQAGDLAQKCAVAHVVRSSARPSPRDSTTEHLSSDGGPRPLLEIVADGLLRCARHRPTRRFDVVGALSAIGADVTVVWAVIGAPERRWTSWVRERSGGAGVANTSACSATTAPASPGSWRLTGQP